MIESGLDLASLLRVIPSELQEVIRKIKAGQIQIHVEHLRLEPLLSALDRVSNRLAFAIVLASLVIGSSLIILSGIVVVWY